MSNNSGPIIQIHPSGPQMRKADGRTPVPGIGGGETVLKTIYTWANRLGMDMVSYHGLPLDGVKDMSKVDMSRVNVGEYNGMRTIETPAVNVAYALYLKAAFGDDEAEQQIYKQVLAHFKEIKPSIVHVHNLHNPIVDVMANAYRRAAEDVGAKTVFTAHNIWEKDPKRPGFFPRGFDEYIFVSDAVRKAYQKRGVHLGSAKVKVMHMGVDRKLFSPTGEHDKRIADRTVNSEPADAHVRIILPGRADEQKGAAVAINAIAELRKRLPGKCITLTLCDRHEPRGQDPGADAYRTTLVQLADRLGVADRVIFEKITHDQMPAALRAADIAINPSVAPEGFALTLMEAMAVGTPAVTTRNGGQEELLRLAYGPFANSMLADSNDPDSLADVLQTLIENEGLQNSASGQGLNAVTRYLNMERAMREQFGIYNALVPGIVPAQELAGVGR